MAKFSDKHVPYPKQEELWDRFCASVATMERFDDVKRFFKDLLNRQERLMLVRRLQIADLLDQGFTYEAIRKRLGVGQATIARVQRWLRFGRDGYRRALKHFRTHH